MKLSVLVTTYGRRTYLERCVESLLAQERMPDEIVIVTRVGDVETEAFVSGLLAVGAGPVAVRQAKVEQPGVLAANRAGMERITGDIVCFIDDDATARPDWLRKIEEWFLKDPTIGAVGGQDLQHTTTGIIEDTTNDVGRITWYGRIVGNHHKRYPGSCFTDQLKGVNMSFRRRLIPVFDDLILGNAHYYEMDLCFAVRHQGYRVRFDGDLVVDHYQYAPRFLPGTALGADPLREYYVHHNQVYVMMKNLSPVKQAPFLVYSFLRDGLACVFKLAIGWRVTDLRVMSAVLRGKCAGLKDYLFSASARREVPAYTGRNRG